MSTMTDTKRVERVGTTEDRSYVVVTMELRTLDGERETVEHETIAGGVELSLTGETYGQHTSPLRGHDSIAAGQIVADLRAVTTPAPGWTPEEIAELADLWDRWHLNGLRAGCAHMDLPEDESYDARKGIACPQTGYQYGRAWLYEPIPGDVLDRLDFLMRHRSHDLYAARGYDAAGNKYPQD